MSTSLSFALALHALLPSPALQEPVAHPAGEAQDEGYSPKVAGASDEGALAMERFEGPEGFEVSLWAAEPLLANPVCFAIDALGRMYVAETFRLHKGVTDMRSHQDWLDEDLASETVADRLAMMARHEGDLAPGYGTEHERVRRLVDTDGDGQADQDTVFADGFKDPASGIAAGLLPRGKDVYYTCIPDLWKLTDADDDGVAEKRESLHTGFGVNIALLGHDMHGLRIGPDGMLYFSIGDRGFHVEAEGKTLAHPHTGAVLRCELDGSGLEVYATGLRNPQELVFDDRGNLFTGDNNSDGGDQARWVYVLEGGDSGWRYAYQWLTRPNLRGPWNAEKQWHPPHAGQPAFLNPPIANFTSGPSGLTYYPGGATWDFDWDGTFFLCDFRGNPTYSGVHSFKNKAKGAGFELVDAKRFLWNSLATDVDFGPDGALYVSDWVDGWGMTGKGRVYRVTPEGFTDNWRARETAQILAAGMRGRGLPELGQLLNHDHRDVRQEAQFELVRRAREDGEEGARSMLVASAKNTGHGTPRRLHGLWGLGQLARTDPSRADLARELPSLLNDLEHEVRAQAAKTLGQLRHAPARTALIAALNDRSPRVRLYAAEALGRIGDAAAVPVLVALLESVGSSDPWLRHAACWALVSIGDRDAVLRLAAHASPHLRRAAAIVLRRWEDARIARLLADADASIAAEAARAVYDVPIPDALPALAARLPDIPLSETYTVRRALNACNALGTLADARRVIAWLVAVPEDCPELLVGEALEILAAWSTPAPRDRVVGAWRPLTARTTDSFAADLVELEASGAPYRWSGEAPQRAWVELVRSGAVASAPEGARLAASLAAGLEGETRFAPRARVLALETLVGAGAGDSAAVLERSFSDEDGRVRAKAYELSARVDPERAVRLLGDAFEAGGAEVRQEVVRALGTIRSDSVAPLLVGWLQALPTGAHPEVTLELVEVADESEDAAVLAALEAWRGAGDGVDEGDFAAWRGTLAGGDWKAGRKVFREKAEVACLRCHAVADDGTSEVGPNLGGVGLARTRAELRESIVYPNRSLGEGYENWILVLDDETMVVGRIAEETPETLRVLTYENGEVGEVELDPAQVTTRKKDVSPMPEDLTTHLSPREMRDLVEFLATRRDEEYPLETGSK